MGLLILPNNPFFYEALDSLPMPFDFNPSKCVVQRTESLLLETVSSKDAREYALGGEYDEVDDCDEELGDE